MEDKKTLYVNRLVKAVEHYVKTHGTGMPMQGLGNRFNRALNSVGGFAEIVEELEAQGLIRIEYTKSGARLVYPGSGSPIQDKASKYF